MSKSKAVEVLEQGLSEANEKLRVNQAERLEIEGEIQDFTRALQALKGSVTLFQKNKPVAAVRKARKKETIRGAVIRIINTEQRFLHIKEIVDALRSEERYVDITTDQVSRTLTGLKSGENKFGLVTHREGLMANTFWGFAYFLNPDNTIKESHIYNKENLLHAVPR